MFISHETKQFGIWRIAGMVLLLSLLLGACNLSLSPESSQETEATSTALVIPTEAVFEEPTVIPEPVMQTEGQDFFLPFDQCFDLDTGVSDTAEAEGCDFSIQSGPDDTGTSIEFFPAVPASFAFAGVYQEEPSLDQCMLSPVLSSDPAVVSPVGFFVCYQTDDGRYGVMHFTNLDAVNGVSFDWKTYAESGAVPIVLATATPTLVIETAEADDGFLVQGTGTSLTYEQCFDLDEGAAFVDDPACDFEIDPGTDEFTMTFIPVAPSRYTFEGAFTNPPALEQCVGSTHYKSDIEVINPLDMHICYQTLDGYFGYFVFRSIDSSGVSFDWYTYDVSGELPEVTATPTATPTMEIPAEDPRSKLGDPFFMDNLDDAGNWSLYSDSHVSFALTSSAVQLKAFNADLYEGFLISWVDISDVYMEIETTTVNCAGADRYGLLLRANEGSGNWPTYLFGVTCDGRYSLRLWDGDSFNQLVAWANSAHINTGTGQTNRIGLWADEGIFQMYVNGHNLGSFTDTTMSSGEFGVFVGSAQTANMTVDLKKVEVWHLP